MKFLEDNKEILSTKDEDEQLKDQTQRRIDDLDIYCTCAKKNFDDLVQGIQEYQERELSAQQETAASSSAGNPAIVKD